jgi:phosphoribosyl-ATP pyrophosphohydrolase
MRFNLTREKMNPIFLKNDEKALLAQVVEEAGEVVAAIGKTIKWDFNLLGNDPTIECGEKNYEWIYRECVDLLFHTQRLVDHLEKVYHAK